MSSLILGVAAILFTAGSYAYQRKQQRKALDRARDARAQDVALTPSAAPVPVPFGRTRVEGKLAYGAVSNNLPTVPTAQSFGTLRAQQGKKREYLLLQHVLGAGEIHRVTDVWIQSESIRSGELAPLSRSEWRNGGTASAFASRFTSDRDANAKFTGLSYLTSAFKHDRDDPKIFGVPDPLAFMEANKVRKVVRAGSAGSYTYTYPAALEYDTNAVAILLHWLTDGTYGPALSVATGGAHWFDGLEVNLERFYQAQEIAGQIVQGDGSVLWNESYPTERNTEAGTNYTGWGDYFGDLGISGITDAGWLNTAITPAGSDPPIKRYEFNGNLAGSRNFADEIEVLLDVMPGIAFWRATNGQYCVDLPDPSRPASTVAVDLVIDDSKLIKPVEVLDSDSSSDLNTARGIFNNSNKNLERDSFTWPLPGSAVETALLAEDRGQVLRGTFTLAGTDNRFAAADVLACRVRTSRRKQYRIHMVSEGFLLEPGDVVPLRVTEQMVDTHVRVRTVRLTPALEMIVDALEYEPLDYQWTSGDKDRDAVLRLVDDSLGDLQKVTAEAADDVVTLTLLPSADESVDVTGYELQVSVDGGAEFRPLKLIGK